MSVVDAGFCVAWAVLIVLFAGPSLGRNRSQNAALQTA